MGELAVRIFPATTRTFTKYTALQSHMSATRHVRARQGHSSIY